MKLHIKIVLTIIVTLLLLIYLAGFMLIFSQAPANWVITGRIMAPSPETTKGIAIANAILTLTDIEGNIHMVATGKDGYYFFNNLSVDANSVITAIAIVNGNTMVFKDVIPEAVAAHETYNAKTADAESTALALIIEELTKQGLTYENIDLEIIQDSDNFEIVEGQVLSVLEDNGNVMDDIIVAGEEVVSGEASDDAPDIEATDEEGKLYKVTVTLREKISDVDSSADTAATYTITASFFGSGTIEPLGAVSVNYDSSQTFTITPNPNYHIDDVLVDGKLVLLKEDGIYNFTDVAADHIIYASFAINTYTLTMNTDGAGTGTVTANPAKTTYEHGKKVTLHAKADPDSTFTGWSGDTSGISNVLLAMTENKNVTASFTLKTYTLDVKTVGNGEGTVTIDPIKETYDHGDEVTISVAAEVSSDFADWAGGDSNDLIDSDKSIKPIFNLKKVTLTVITEGTGSGTVSPAEGVHTYDYGDEVTIGAKPDTGSIGTWISKKTDVGSIFTGWSGDASGTSDMILVMDSDKSVTATFTKKETYTLTMAVTGTGSGTVSPAVGVHTYNYGDEITIGATPDTALTTWVSDKADLGSIFTGWSGDASGTGDMTLIMDSDKSIIANFTLTEVTLTVAITGTGSGTVSPAVGVHTYNYGETVIITATADVSSNFTGRSGDAPGTGDMTLIMDSDKSVTSVFNLKTYTITASTVSNGSFSPSGRVTVEHGSSKSFSITPNTNYNIEDVKVDGSSVGAVASYTFTDVTVDHTISASFDPAAVSFAVTTENLGTETAGTAFSVTITAKDNEGNTATGYTGSHNIIWSSNATNSPNATAPTKPAEGNQTFSNGAVTVTGFILTNSGETPTITATATGAAGTTPEITVNSGALASLTFDAVADQTAGSSFSVALTAADSYGNAVTGSYNVAWSSNATNSPNGTEPTMAGTADLDFSAGTVTVAGFKLYNSGETPTITATATGAAGTTPEITVNSGALASFTFNGVGTQEAGAEFSVDLSDAVDTYGNTVVGSYNVAWSSNANNSPNDTEPTMAGTADLDFSAGAVTVTGFILTNSGETPAITATATGAAGTTPEITVDSGALDHITVTPASVDVAAGANQTFSAQGYDQYNNEISGLIYTWSITSGGGTIVAGTDVFTAGATLGLFADTIEATSGGVTGTTSVTVIACVPAKFTITFRTDSGTYPQKKDKPFGITITAIDVDENTENNYTGEGTLALINRSSTAHNYSDGDEIVFTDQINKVPIEISGTVATITVVFINGVWEDSVTIGATSAVFLGLEKGDSDALVSIKITFTYDDDTTVTGESDSFIVE